MIQGYDNRVNVQWQQTRLVIYTIACTVTEPDKRVSLYEMMPLKGDPTAEQLMQEAKKNHDMLLKKQKDFTEMVRQKMASKKEASNKQQVTSNK